MSEEHQKRYFELKDEKSAKFWEVSLEGVTVGVRYGKIGAVGQAQSKSFGDAAAARRHADKLVVEKTGKGYVESGSVAPPESTTAADSQARAPALPAKKAAVRKPAVLSPAKDPEASPEALLGLLDQDDATNRLLAAHPKADAQLLEKLSHSSDSATRRLVAKNPNTPQQVYVRLGQQFPKEFLANPMLDLLLLENPALMEQVPEALLIRLLKQADCPAPLLTWASAHPRAKVQLAVAMNPGAGHPAKERLRQSRHADVRDAVERAKVDVGPDPARAFEQAVRERLGSMTQWELGDAWEAGDIGLAQWHILPLKFRLHRAAASSQFGQSAAVVRLISELGWSLPEVQASLPGFERWFDVARSPKLSETLLSDLAQDKSANVRWGVAENPMIPASVLDALANDRDEYVRSSVAIHPNISLPVIEKLAGDSSERVRAPIAGRLNTPAHVLEVLARDHDWVVRCVVARNPSAPVHVMELLANDSESNVRGMVVSNPMAPALTLEALSQDSAAGVREVVARSPRSSPAAFLALSSDPHHSVRVAAAKNPACSGPVLEGLAGDADLQVRDAVAQNDAAPPHVLEAIFRTGGRSIHWELARNPATPLQVLDLLSRQDDPWIQAKVAQHPSLPERTRSALLEAMSKRPAERDRKGAAENIATPPSSLKALSRDKKTHVRYAAASNSHCPVEELRRLARDESDVQVAVAKNPNTPLDTLVMLTDSKVPQVRQTLALQAHRSDELRRKLWSDPDDAVRSLTASRPALTSEVLDDMLQGYQVESDLLTLFGHPNLGHASAQVIAEKLFNTPAEQSPWFLREQAKVTAGLRAAVKSRGVPDHFGKDSNRDVLAKRPMAAIMALCAGSHIEVARIVKVAGSTDWLVRAAVAQNLGTPPNLLMKLTSDAIPLVCALARHRLAKHKSAKAT